MRKTFVSMDLSSSVLIVDMLLSACMWLWTGRSLCVQDVIGLWEQDGSSAAWTLSGTLAVFDAQPVTNLLLIMRSDLVLFRDKRD